MTTKKNITTMLRVGGLGLALMASTSTAQSPEPTPAAKFARAVPIHDPSSLLKVRGLAPAPEVAAPAPGAPWMHGPMPTTIRPLPLNQPVGTAMAPQNSDSTWQSFKNFLYTPPLMLGVTNEANKPPSQTQTSQPAFAPPATPRPIQQTPQTPQMPQTNNGIYAGPPAYRWYGWGTTTPGRNPHAPTGNSPQGSNAWYAQTGATPGAFPVTAQPSGQLATQNMPAYMPNNSYRPLIQAPISFDQLQPAPYANSPYPPLPPGARVIADGAPAPYMLPATSIDPAIIGTSQPSILPMPTQSYIPSIPVPPQNFGIGQPVTTAMPPMNFPTAMVPNGEQNVSWTTAQNGPNFAVPPSIPQPPTGWGMPLPTARPQAPQVATEVTLETQIKSAVQHIATVETIRYVGMSKMLVRLQVSTPADAKIATDAISKIPAIKPFTVDFEVVALSAK